MGASHYDERFARATVHPEYIGTHRPRAQIMLMIRASFSLSNVLFGLCSHLSQFADRTSLRECRPFFKRPIENTTVGGELLVRPTGGEGDSGNFCSLIHSEAY